MDKLSKRFRAVLPCLLCLLALAACQRAETRVNAVAETFLNAYYTADYQEAAQWCTPAFAQQVEKGAEAQSRVPQEIAQKMKEAVSQTSFKIVSVEVDKEAGKALVCYELQVPGLEKPVPKRLRLQLEGRTAQVDGIE